MCKIYYFYGVKIVLTKYKLKELLSYKTNFKKIVPVTFECYIRFKKKTKLMINNHLLSVIHLLA